MRIRMLVCAVGKGYVRNAGDQLDLPDAEAGRLVAAGQAEPVAMPLNVQADRPKRRGRGRVADNPSARPLEVADAPGGRGA